MPKGVNSRNERQVAAWLPVPFVDSFKTHLKKLTKASNGIRKITEREYVHEAIVEKMERDKVAKAV